MSYEKTASPLIMLSFKKCFLHTKVRVVFTLIDALKDIESLELQLQDMIDGQKKDQSEQEIKQADEKSTVFIKSEKKN